MSNLERLLESDPMSRDEAWEKAFLKELPQASFRLLSQEPQVGPDNWPYLMVATGGANDPEATEPATKVFGWLSERGIGLAINPDKTAPDMVLSYGMIWNFRERGEFLSEPAPERASRIELKNGQELLTGAPSMGYLPQYARKILKQFLMDQGVLAPKVLMVSFDKVNYDLCFSIESLKSPPQQEHAAIAEALSWFLPAHYGVALISEKAVPGFQSI